MSIITTHDQLFVKYLYCETNLTENQAFTSSLHINSALYESYQTALIIKNNIDNLGLMPSVKTENTILAYC